jgi:NADPH:quinone reductase-like Zn-dependent oxidoreductase
MKAVRIYEPIGPAGLVYEEAPEPVVGVGDVVVEVHAAGFTPGELDWPPTWKDRSGHDRAPSIPGREVAGVVTALGYGTTGFAIGDEVVGLTDPHRDGAAAERMTIEARDLAPKPGSLDAVQAAGLPMSGLTAWQGLIEHGRLQSGQAVLVHGAAGGVGTIAVQLARSCGATVIGSGRGAVRSLVHDLGAEHFVDLENDRLEDVGQVDLVFDAVGGEILDRSAALVKPGGALVTITTPPSVEPTDARSVYFIVERSRAQLVELGRLVEAGRIDPHVGAVYPLSAAKEAFTAKPGIAGKVVLQP